VRFTTAANLVNELVEAKQQLQLRRVLARWSRYDVIAIDEVGYVPLAEVGAEFLFQVVAERAEKKTVILTTLGLTASSNLPFSEWTQVFPNARLCKALLDRITDRAHIIETGTESFRFRRTMDRRRRKACLGGIPRSDALKGAYGRQPGTDPGSGLKGEYPTGFLLRGPNAGGGPFLTIKVGHSGLSNASQGLGRPACDRVKAATSSTLASQASFPCGTGVPNWTVSLALPHLRPP